jgi:hypothetical protein
MPKLHPWGFEGARIVKQAVQRTINRFPEEFIFEINNLEAELLVSQNVTP